MRITWNQNESRFEAQFGTGNEWQRDQTAASSAGFHSDGPPQWIWHTHKASSLTKLKESRTSISALSITPEALASYNRLHAIEQRNDELKAWAKEQKKKLAKEEEREKIEKQREEIGEECEPEYEARHYREIPEYWKGKNEITRADLPADVLARFVQHEPIPQRRAEPTGICVICAGLVYFFEKQDPPTCLWCEGKGEDQFFEELIA